MVEPTETVQAGDERPELHTTRLQLVWDVVLFQFKLAADGLRDLLLSPVSIAAGLFGLIAGGDDPHRYFHRLLRFGRRSEGWINLFGGHGQGTSDELVDGLRQRVFTEATTNPWLRAAGTHLNERLDSARPPAERPPPDNDSTP